MLKVSRKLSPLVLTLAVLGCNQVSYDPKSLGFSDKSEMEGAFAKGYHTKQKLTEMTQSTSVRPSQAAENQSPSAPSEMSQGASNELCSSLTTCIDAMLVAGKTQSIEAAQQAAKRIDSFPKPPRGDRKLARKLNNDGLEALKNKNYTEATSLLNQAHEADKSDEEVVANLAFAYSLENNYAKSESIAYEGLLLNPRRSNLWLPIAIAKQKQKKPIEAMEALWLAWEFSGDKQRFINLITKRSSDDPDADIKEMFNKAKSWFVEGNKPAL